MTQELALFIHGSNSTTGQSRLPSVEGKVLTPLFMGDIPKNLEVQYILCQQIMLPHAKYTDPLSKEWKLGMVVEIKLSENWRNTAPHTQNVTKETDRFAEVSEPAD